MKKTGSVCLCVVLGLVLLLAASSDASTHALSHPSLCCFRFVQFKIPAKNILKIEKTHSGCPMPGYVVTTPRGKFCKKDLQQS